MSATKRADSRRAVRVAPGRLKPGELVTRREAADLLRVSIRTIDRMIIDGQLRPVRIGRLVRIHASDLRLIFQ